MTTKDYVKFANLFAGEIALANTYSNDPGKRQIIVNIIRSSADIFAQDNPRFDRERFYQASGLEIVEQCESSEGRTARLWG